MKAILDDLWLFSEVARIGTLSTAAQELNIPAATLSRKIRILESTLGMTLLQRQSRGLVLTAEGQELRERCTPHLLQSLDGLQSVLENQGQLRGSLRISSPVSIAERMLIPWGMDFMDIHPEIDLEFKLGQEHLSAENCDIEVRVAPLVDTNRKAKRLISTDYILAASKEYLERKGVPNHPKDLYQHDRIVCLPERSWHLSHSNGDTEVVRSKIRFAINAHEVVCSVTRRGMGIANISQLAVEDDLKQGNLVHVLPDWTPKQFNVYMIYSGDGPTPPRLREFLNYVEQRAKIWVR